MANNQFLNLFKVYKPIALQQTENGAAQLGNGVVAAAGLVAAGAFLI